MLEKYWKMKFAYSKNRRQSQSLEGGQIFKADKISVAVLDDRRFNLLSILEIVFGCTMCSVHALAQRQGIALDYAVCQQYRCVHYHVLNAFDRNKI